METKANLTRDNRIPSVLAGVAFGCLSVLILFLCTAGVLVALIARSDYNTATARQSSDPVENGQQIFQMRCSPCHSSGTDMRVGPGLAGTFSPGGPALPGGVDYGGELPNGKEINETNVAEWIREGGQGEIGPMPGQALSEAQMADLIAYLKTLQR